MTTSNSMVFHETAAVPHTPRAPMELLVAMIETLSSARRPEDIAACVRTAARELTGADGVAVVLRDNGRCHYVDEDSIAPLWKGLKFPMTACISGWTMLNRQTAVIPDIYKDDRIPHDAYRPTFVKSMVMIPVRPEDPVAAIGAYWAQERMPTADEVAGLQAIARATATAFENVTLIATLEDSLQRRDFLIHELDHRVKNMLGLVQAIAHQCLGRDPGPEQVKDFGRRIAALSHVHELLARQSWKTAPLRDLVDAAMAPFAKMDAQRITITAPEITLSPEAAVALAMSLHELGANATRHGALSNEEGRVEVTWTLQADVEDRHLNLVWRESGGPAPRASTSPGMGTALLTRALPRALGGGSAELTFPPEGACYRLTVPLGARVALA